jgi:hypothetical protein
VHAAGSIPSDDGALHVDKAKAPGLSGDGVHYHGRVQDGAKRLENLPERIIGDDRGQVAHVNLALVRQLVSGSLSWRPTMGKAKHSSSHGRMWCGSIGAAPLPDSKASAVVVNIILFAHDSMVNLKLCKI